MEKDEDGPPCRRRSAFRDESSKLGKLQRVIYSLCYFQRLRTSWNSGRIAKRRIPGQSMGRSYINQSGIMEFDIFGVEFVDDRRMKGLFGDRHRIKAQLKLIPFCYTPHALIGPVDPLRASVR